jgi:hypothetical protein
MEDVFMPADVVRQGPSTARHVDYPACRHDAARKRKSGGWTEEDIAQTQSTMRAVYDSLPGDGYFVQVPGMFHIDLTDLTYVSPVFPGNWLQRADRGPAGT